MRSGIIISMVLIRSVSPYYSDSISCFYVYDMECAGVYIEHDT